MQDVVAASHRDPAGRLYRVDDRIMRRVNAGWKDNVRRFLDLPRTRRLIAEGRLIGSLPLGNGEVPAAILEAVEPGGLFIEHERVPFVSYPFEWPAEMLHAAAALTLSIAMEYLDDGFGLKDATPFNILYRGPKPVFVDVLSFEPRDPLDPVWRPEGQFVRTTVLPLMANKYFGIPPAPVFLARREGLEPEDVARLVGPLRRWLPPFLWTVTLPTLLARFTRNPDVYRTRKASDTEKARFILDMLFRRLDRSLRKLQPLPDRSSTWSEYERTHSYSEADFGQKKESLLGILERYKPSRVLDVGCNEGLFSMLAAEAGASVVALDLDPVVIGRVWQRAFARNLDVLPMVQDLSHPSPATGWRNREFPSFLDRARGRFDLVLMLAVVHHLLVTDRAPIEEIFDLVAEITSDLALVEFVGPSDPMFRTIARGRDDLYAGFDEDAFAAAAGRRFDVLERHPLKDTGRVLYLFRLRR